MILDAVSTIQIRLTHGFERMNVNSERMEATGFSIACFLVTNDHSLSRLLFPVGTVSFDNDPIFSELEVMAGTEQIFLLA
jgi:hypothetical protein